MASMPYNEMINKMKGFTVSINSVDLKVKLTDPNAVIPVYKHNGDSGMDIRSIEAVYIKPNTTVRIATGVAFGIPDGYEIQVRPRSGLANKGIVAQFGTVDSGYRDQLSIIMTNNSFDTFKVEIGDRIAQVVLAPVSKANMILTEKLDETDRGLSGHGSTGIK